jgi:3-methyladenine DNA glycosylase AlkD
MTLHEAMAQLEALGTQRMRDLNTKNGAGDNQFGVKMGDIRTVAKEIKSDPELAKQLWASGNLDAMLLATLILKPKLLSEHELEAMVKDAEVPQLADWLNSYVVKLHPQREELRQKWMSDSHEMISRSAWSLTSDKVVKDPKGLDFDALLDRIDREMASAPPKAQWTMNFTLGNIGIHSAAHRDRALEIGERLGIYRDYPCSPGCTSPFVPIWINEMVRRQG